MSETPVLTNLRKDGENVIAHTYQDVEDIVERNKARQNERQSGDWHHIAEIPCNILNMWLHTEWERGNVSLTPFGPEMDALVKRKLRDPDWAWLRATNRRF